MSASAAVKIVRCCHCRGMMRVSSKALSVFCPHCQKRATLETLRIVGSHPGRVLATCGDLFIEPSAKLNLDLIATKIHINGRVRGSVNAFETVEIGPSGFVIGDIKAIKITVQDGGVIQGRCEMTFAPPKPEASAPDAAPAPEVQPASDDLIDLNQLEPGGPDKRMPPAFRPRPLPLPNSAG